MSLGSLMKRTMIYSVELQISPDHNSLNPALHRLVHHQRSGVVLTNPFCIPGRPLCRRGHGRPAFRDLVSFKPPENKAVELHLLARCRVSPPPVLRHTTLSPSAIMSSIVMRRSGMDWYTASIICSSPS